MKEEAGNCSAIEGQIPLYVGRDLDAEVVRTVEAHLAFCVACRDRVRRAREAREILVAGLGRSSAQPRDMWPAVRTALFNEGWISGEKRIPSEARARVETPRAVPTAVRSAATRKSPLRTLSLAAGVLFAGFLLGRMAFEPSETVPPGRDLPSVVQPDLTASAPEHVTPVQPIAVSAPADGGLVANGGLRRLAPGEARLSDTAELYDPESNWNVLRWSSDKNFGSPASLQRPSPSNRTPPRH